jgi:hypothetical protein
MTVQPVLGTASSRRAPPQAAAEGDPPAYGDVAVEFQLLRFVEPTAHCAAAWSARTAAMMFCLRALRNLE